MGWKFSGDQLCGDIEDLQTLLAQSRQRHGMSFFTYMVTMYAIRAPVTKRYCKRREEMRYTFQMRTCRRLYSVLMRKARPQVKIYLIIPNDAYQLCRLISNCRNILHPKPSWSRNTKKKCTLVRAAQNEFFPAKSHWGAQGRKFSDLGSHTILWDLVSGNMDACREFKHWFDW